jgi:hypothetical protein
MFIKVGTRHKRAMSRYSDRRARFAVPDIQCVGELNSQADFSADVPRLAAVTLNPLRRCRCLSTLRRRRPRSEAAGGSCLPRQRGRLPPLHSTPDRGHISDVAGGHSPRFAPRLLPSLAVPLGFLALGVRHCHGLWQTLLSHSPVLPPSIIRIVGRSIPYAAALCRRCLALSKQTLPQLPIRPVTPQLSAAVRTHALLSRTGRGVVGRELQPHPRLRAVHGSISHTQHN